MRLILLIILPGGVNSPSADVDATILDRNFVNAGILKVGVDVPI